LVARYPAGAVCGSARCDFFGRIYSDLVGFTRMWSDQAGPGPPSAMHPLPVSQA